MIEAKPEILFALFFTTELVMTKKVKNTVFNILLLFFLLISK